MSKKSTQESAQCAICSFRAPDYKKVTREPLAPKNETFRSQMTLLYRIASIKMVVQKCFSSLTAKFSL